MAQANKQKANQKRLAWLLVTMVVLGTVLVYQLNVKQARAQTTITNQAEAVWEDSGGASFGPAYSNQVVTNITTAPGSTFDLSHLQESHQTHQGLAVVNFYSAGTSNLVGSVTDNTDSSGSASSVNTPGEVVNGQSYDIVLKVSYCLSKKLSNIVWPPSSALNFGTLLAGDLNDDNYINNFDWSNMNTNWRTANAIADINQDGLVNTIDWGIMNKNWWVSGQ